VSVGSSKTEPDWLVRRKRCVRRSSRTLRSCRSGHAQCGSWWRQWLERQARAGRP